MKWARTFARGRGFLWRTSVGLVATSLAVAPALASDDMTAVCGHCVVEKVATCGGFLEGIVSDRSGALWALDVSGSRILKIGVDGRCEERARTPGHPNGAKRLADGRFLVSGAFGLIYFDPANDSITQRPLSFAGKPVTGVNDIAVDEAGGLYITQSGASSASRPLGRLLYVPKHASEARLVADRIAFANGLVTSADGEWVLVSEFALKRILSFPSVTAKGPFQMDYVWAVTSGGVGVDGMTRDQQGRVFGANLGSGEVLVYSPDARLLGAIRLPSGAGKFVTNVTIANDHLYITEAGLGEVWRVRLAP